MKKITLEVKGMHCPSCEMLVKDSLEEFEGVENVRASFKEHKVELEMDSSVISLGKIRQIIQNEGYEVA